jgi:hypothetical protein
MKKYKQILCDLTLDSGPTQKDITVWRGVVHGYLPSGVSVSFPFR